MSNSKRVSTVAERITLALKMRNMKAIELSERSGIAKGAISGYINNRYEPKRDSLFKLAKVLDVNEMWLAGYDIPMQREKSNISSLIIPSGNKEDIAIFKQISNLDPSKKKMVVAFLEAIEAT